LAKILLINSIELLAAGMYKAAELKPLWGAEALSDTVLKMILRLEPAKTLIPRRAGAVVVAALRLWIMLLASSVLAPPASIPAQ